MTLITSNRDITETIDYTTPLAAAKHRGPVYKSEPPKFQVTLNQYTMTLRPLGGLCSEGLTSPRQTVGRTSRVAGARSRSSSLKPVHRSHQVLLARPRVDRRRLEILVPQERGHRHQVDAGI